MKILVVDDFDDLRLVLSLFLERHGFKVFTCSNGAEALNFLTTSQIEIDLLITDYDMPLMNGGQLIEKIISYKIKFKKIIILSGIPSNEEKLSKILDGNSNIIFVQKVISAKDLLHHIFHN